MWLRKKVVPSSRMGSLLIKSIKLLLKVSGIIFAAITAYVGYDIGRREMAKEAAGNSEEDSLEGIIKEDLTELKGAVSELKDTFEVEAKKAASARRAIRRKVVDINDKIQEKAGAAKKGKAGNAGTSGGESTG